MSPAHMNHTSVLSSHYSRTVSRLVTLSVLFFFFHIQYENIVNNSGCCFLTAFIHNYPYRNHVLLSIVVFSECLQYLSVTRCQCIQTGEDGVWMYKSSKIIDQPSFLFSMFVQRSPVIEMTFCFATCLPYDEIVYLGTSAD